MRIGAYIKDKGIEILLSLILLFLIIWLMIIFKLNIVALVIISGLVFLIEAAKLLYDYFRKEKFYTSLINNAARLDKAYLVLETLEAPNFLEGKLLMEALYDIDKSMAENVNMYVSARKEYREYIERWIHEVKLPLSAISLKLHNMLNSENKPDPAVLDSYKKIQAEVNRITEYVDQVLYYSRSENAEKDYHISKSRLGSIIHPVVMDFRETLLDGNIDLRIDVNGEAEVNTDTKWLRFILGQLISNSIKYRKTDTESYIKIYSEEDENSIWLYVEDNGIGISEEDIKRVFDKSFTGKNGKIKAQSTGMGLYIVKELAGKLGHTVGIESSENEWTRVCIEINKNDFYDV